MSDYLFLLVVALLLISINHSELNDIVLSKLSSSIYSKILLLALKEKVTNNILYTTTTLNQIILR